MFWEGVKRPGVDLGCAPETPEVPRKKSPEWNWDFQGSTRIFRQKMGFLGVFPLSRGMRNTRLKAKFEPLKRPFVWIAAESESRAAAPPLAERPNK